MLHHVSEKVKDLIGQFKTHVWNLMEMHNGAIFHVSEYLLAKIDNVQHSWLRKLEVSENGAYLSYNFGPTKLHPIIGILGLLLGESHPTFKILLPFSAEIGRPLLPDGYNK